MQNFVIIQNVRIHANTIKKYRPQSTNQLYIYYSASRNRIDFEDFKFETEEERDEVLTMLDAKL